MGLGCGGRGMSQAAVVRRRDKSAAMMEICSVHLGRAMYGVPISHILEIVGPAKVQPVPLAPGFVGGLVHYRGDVLTAVNLRHLLHMPPFDGPQDILVLESPGGCFSLLVDTVGEVLTVSSADFDPNPSTLDKGRKDFLAGAYKLQNALLVILAPPRVVSARPLWGVACAS